MEKFECRVKVCGVRSLVNAVACVKAGADLLGINFYPKSKRFVAFDEARVWLPELAGCVERVGLFVNAERDDVLRIMESGDVDFAQFHGDETVEDLAFYAERGVPFFKAIRVAGAESLAGMETFSTDRFVLDAYSSGGYGGTGETFDWELARKAVTDHPEFKIMLSGGLVPENVAAAVATVRPWAVDVASGVESAPGVKDVPRVGEFVAAVRGV
jgi:phosphoribosylanthranilate isomerase